MSKHVACANNFETVYLMYKTFCIGTVTLESNDAGEESWVIKVDWNTWDTVGKPDIGGIDTSLRLNEYVRDYVPYLIDIRVPCEERKEDYTNWGMKYYDPIEFLKRTRGIATTYDNFYFSQKPDDFIDIYKVTYQELKNSYMQYCGYAYEEKMQQLKKNRGLNI